MSATVRLSARETPRLHVLCSVDFKPAVGGFSSHTFVHLNGIHVSST